MVTTRITRQRPPGARDLLAVRGQVNVFSYGATGDGSTDDNAAIVLSIAAATARRDAGKSVTLVFPDCAGYASSQPVTIPKGINVLMDAPIIYTGSGNVAILTMGTTGASGVTFKARHKLAARRSVQSDWTNEANVAIKLVNLNTSDVDIVEAQNCTIGVQCVGNAEGFAYNRIKLGYLISNKVGVDLDAVAAGYCNENTFHKGRFGNGSGVNAALERIGVRISGSDTTYTTNNNLFIGPSFELTRNGGTSNCVCFDVVYGQNNYSLHARSEGNDLLGRFANTAQGNDFHYGYVGGSGAAANLNVWGTGYKADTSTTGTNIVRGGNGQYVDQPGRIIFDCPDLAAVSRPDDATPLYRVDGGLSIVRTAAQDYKRAWTTLTPATDCLTIGAARGVGTRVDTNRAKRFLATKGIKNAGTTGRWLVRCYDGAGTLLTDADPGHPYVRASIGGLAFSATGTWGGYVTGSDADYPLRFEVTDNVKSIFVGVIRGSADVDLQSLQVACLDPIAPRVWPGHGLAGGPGRGFGGYAAYDPPSIAAGGTTTTTVTVTGASLGDMARASFSLSLGGLNLTAYVSAANTVTCVLHNPTAGAIDLGSGTLRAWVE